MAEHQVICSLALANDQQNIEEKDKRKKPYPPSLNYYVSKYAATPTNFT